MTKILVAIAFVALNFYIYEYFASTELIPERSTFDNFPLEIDDWTCSETQTMEPDVLQNLGVTDYLMCNYTRGSFEDVINVYVGYHQTQVRKGGKANSIHPPEHCLPGSGWDIIDSKVVPLQTPGRDGTSGEAKRFIIAKGNSRQLVYFWYQSRGRVLARNHEVILYRVWARAARQRTDGSLVRLTIPIVNGEIEQSERVFRDFTTQLAPLLPDFVPI